MIETGRLISGRYEIREKIGTGGMADVYKAMDTRLNRLVAVKVLKSEFSDDKSFITRFKNEAKAAAGLSHPNIVSVYDVGEDSGSHYIVMELVEGLTLKKFIAKKGRLDVREAVAIAIQIAQGMEVAHENKIIHRDIKPQNIIISRDGKVKVADFGIAKVVSSDTFTQNAVGSVHYLSPEQARGGYSDARSDIYSLGVTLYEMLTGQLPFGGESDVSVALKHINTEAKPAKEIVPTIPYSLDRVVQKCMQKHPEKRYSSVSDLIIDLKHSLTNPNGDFVWIKDGSEGGTKNFSNEEVEEIKSTAAAQRSTYVEEEKPQVQPQPRRAAQPVYDNSHLAREDYEELDTIDSKFEKVVIIITIVVAVALIIGAAVLFAKLFGSSALGNNKQTNVTPGITENVTPGPTAIPVSTITMPNLYGYTKADAEAFVAAKSAQFTIIYEDAEYSTQPEGTVIKQYPLANTDVLTNQTIKITLSAGGKPITVPRLVGLSEANAKNQLTAIGFVVQPVYENNDSIPVGQVTRTNPSNGVAAHEGDSILIYVSLGPAQTYVQIPDVVNKSAAVAKELLEDAGLICSEDFLWDYSNTIDYGMVIFQSKEANTMSIANTSVQLTLSMGPFPSPDSFQKYYSCAFDASTIDRRIYYDCGGTASYTDYLPMFFEIQQEDVVTIIYTNFDSDKEEDQNVQVNYWNFAKSYDFKLYCDFEFYYDLHPGEAYITAYLNGNDIGTQKVFLEVVSE